MPYIFIEQEVLPFTPPTRLLLFLGVPLARPSSTPRLFPANSFSSLRLPSLPGFSHHAFLSSMPPSFFFFLPPSLYSFLPIYLLSSNPSSHPPIPRSLPPFLSCSLVPHSAPLSSHRSPRPLSLSSLFSYKLGQACEISFQCTNLALTSQRILLGPSIHISNFFFSWLSIPT